MPAKSKSRSKVSIKIKSRFLMPANIWMVTETNKYERFHVRLWNKKRTTISIEQYFADVMAINLEKTPRTLEAHKAIQEWLQEKQDSYKQVFLKTYLIKFEIFMELLDPQILREYGAWSEYEHKTNEKYETLRKDDEELNKRSLEILAAQRKKKG
jgi:hypothetical protein